MTGGCTICKKKIKQFMMAVYTCRCKNIYCVSHLHNHNCTFDYHAEFTTKMKKNMPIIVADKIDKI